MTNQPLQEHLPVLPPTEAKPTAAELTQIQKDQQTATKINEGSSFVTPGNAGAHDILLRLAGHLASGIAKDEQPQKENS